ncbi:hypothetical protein N9B82_05175 [Saprospiraceae bacterium]|nr:hypothetical protein [Saprospiraceae bacterium]
MKNQIIILLLFFTINAYAQSNVRSKGKNISEEEREIISKNISLIDLQKDSLCSLVMCEEFLLQDTIDSDVLNAVIDILLRDGSTGAIDLIFTYRNKFMVTTKKYRNNDPLVSFIDYKISRKLSKQPLNQSNIESDFLDYLLFSPYLETLRSTEDLRFITEILSHNEKRLIFFISHENKRSSSIHMKNIKLLKKISGLEKY